MFRIIVFCLSSIVIVLSSGKYPVASIWSATVLISTSLALGDNGYSSKGITELSSSIAPIDMATALLSFPTSLATSFGTGGNSPDHTGASPVSFIGATRSSSCSGSASTICQVLPAITNLLALPRESSLASLFSDKTNASSTEPRTDLLTASRTL